MKNSWWESPLGDELNLAVPLREPPPSLEGRLMDAVAGSPRRSRFPGRAWGGLAAAAILILAGGNLTQWLLSKPAPMKSGLQVVMMSGGPLAPKAFGTIVLDPDDNHGILAVRDLPKPPRGQYQLWLKKGTEVRSAGLFSVNADGYGSLSLTIPSGFLGFHEFFLTVEPLEGSPLPTAPPVMVGSQ